MGALLLLGMVTLPPAFTPTAAGAATGCSTTITSSHPGEGLGVSPANVHDGQGWWTYFDSSHDDWQHIQFDFGCVGTFRGLSRIMLESRGQVPAAGAARIGQGETVSYSLDGVNWTRFTPATTSGWEAFDAYSPHAWHSVDYGSSPALVLDHPVPARYVRFEWDDDHDLLTEIHLDIAFLGLDAACEVVNRQYLCEAAAHGGAGGPYTFAWQTPANPVIASSNTASTASGHCVPGRWFTIRVTATDQAGQTVQRSMSRYCPSLGGPPFQRL